MRKHLVKVLKQKIDEKVDLASTVKAAFAAIDDESLDNKADNDNHLDLSDLGDCREDERIRTTRIDEKRDLASTVKTAITAMDIAAMNDESLDNNVYIDYLKQLFEEKDARIEPILKQEKLTTEKDLEVELTGHIQNIVKEVDNEEELVWTIQQLANGVKHGKKKQAILS